MPRSKNSSGSIPPKYKKKRTSRLSRSASVRAFILLWRAVVAGNVTWPCCACLVSHPWQLVPYDALGLGWDGANNLASSRLESWALDDSSVEWKFNLLDKREETIAERFKIVLAEKPNVQEAAERSRNRKQFSCCCCCSHINSHNQVRGHRTGSSHSGAEEYPSEKHKQPRVVHAYITADAIHASTRNM